MGSAMAEKFRDARILDGYRQEWRKAVLRTDRSDREVVASAVKKLYSSLRQPAPDFILWFDSPLDGVWAQTLLHFEQDPQFFQSLCLSSSSLFRRGVGRARERLMLATGLTNWDEVSERLIPRGPQAVSVTNSQALPKIHFEWMLGLLREHGCLRALSTRLPADSAASDVARSQPDVCDKSDPLFLLKDDIDQTTRLCFHARGSSVPIQLEQAAGEVGAQVPPPVLTIGHLSLGHLARIELLAQESEASIPEALLHIADIAKQSSLWWAFPNAFVACEPPVEIFRNAIGKLHREDGPALVYRNGWAVWAVDGKRVERVVADELEGLHGAPTMNRQLTSMPRSTAFENHPILRAQLPKTKLERIAVLRDAAEGVLPLYERYAAGECVTVWNELHRMKWLARGTYAPDVLAVVYETMERVLDNIQMLVSRLTRLGYEFDHEPLELPTDKQREALRRVDAEYGPLPLSLRAFYDVVGAVSLTGSHPLLSWRAGDPDFPVKPVLTDPLRVDPLGSALVEFEEEERHDVFAFAPDRFHKHNMSGGEALGVRLPCHDADAVIEGEQHRLKFVDYLRLSFLYGGFSGFDVDPTRVPAREMAILTEQLRII